MNGPRFDQTGYGRRFFEAQLPKLIQNLGRIADALERLSPNTAGAPAVTPSQGNTNEDPSN